jgi:hypothetical protein
MNATSQIPHGWKASGVAFQGLGQRISPKSEIRRKGAQSYRRLSGGYVHILQVGLRRSGFGRRGNSFLAWFVGWLIPNLTNFKTWKHQCTRTPKTI